MTLCPTDAKRYGMTHFESPFTKPEGEKQPLSLLMEGLMRMARRQLTPKSYSTVQIPAFSMLDLLEPQVGG